MAQETRSAQPKKMRTRDGWADDAKRIRASESDPLCTDYFSVLKAEEDFADTLENLTNDLCRKVKAARASLRDALEVGSAMLKEIRKNRRRRETNFAKILESSIGRANAALDQTFANMAERKAARQGKKRKKAGAR